MSQQNLYLLSATKHSLGIAAISSLNVNNQINNDFGNVGYNHDNNNGGSVRLSIPIKNNNVVESISPSVPIIHHQFESLNTNNNKAYSGTIDAPINNPTIIDNTNNNEKTIVYSGSNVVTISSSKDSTIIENSTNRYNRMSSNYYNNVSKKPQRLQPINKSKLNSSSISYSNSQLIEHNSNNNNNNNNNTSAIYPRVANNIIDTKWQELDNIINNNDIIDEEEEILIKKHNTNNSNDINININNNGDSISAATNTITRIFSSGSGGCDLSRFTGSIDVSGLDMQSHGTEYLHEDSQNTESNSNEIMFDKLPQFYSNQYCDSWRTLPLPIEMDQNKADLEVIKCQKKQ